MQKMLQLQELGLAATVTNILDNEGEPQGFAEASKSEACKIKCEKSYQV
jgi:hypothetical protein